MTSDSTVLAELLAAEHAAVYGYGVLGSRLDPARRTLALAAHDDHRVLRDLLVQRMAARGLATPGPELAYAMTVATPGSAVRQAISLEEGLGVLWRDLVAATDGADLRALAVRSLSAAAVRAVRWRQAGGITPLTTPWPGQP